MLTGKKIVSISALVLITLGLILLWPRNYAPGVFEALESDSKKVIVSINGKRFAVEIMKTDTEKAQGLSNREYLPSGQGALFIFDPPEQPMFWMRQMRFAIDIVWIRNGRVVGIERQVSPQPGVKEDELTLYPAPGEIDYVLEINAGEANDFKIGDEVQINFSKTI